MTTKVCSRIVVMLVMGMAVSTLCGAAAGLMPQAGMPGHYYQNGGGMMINSELLGIASLIYLLHGFITGEEGKKPILDIMREQGSFKKLITIVALLGVAGCVLKLSWDTSKKIPAAWTSFNGWLGRFFNKMFCSSTPLQPDRLLVWEQVFEGKVKHLYDQSSAGNLMLKNLRVSDGENRAEDTHWRFFVGEVKDVFNHIIEYLQLSMPYYEQGEHAYAVGTQTIAKLTQGISSQDRADIAFMSKTIMSNLRHLITICEQAEGFDTLDSSHIKRLASSTMLLMRKMRTLLQGEGNSAAQSGIGTAQIGQQMAAMVNPNDY